MLLLDYSLKGNAHNIYTDDLDIFSCKKTSLIGIDIMNTLFDAYANWMTLLFHVYLLGLPASLALVLVFAGRPGELPERFDRELDDFRESVKDCRRSMQDVKDAWRDL